MAFLIHFVFFAWNVELSEEVEGDDRVDVNYDGQQHDGQDQLLAIVSDGL